MSDDLARVTEETRRLRELSELDRARAEHDRLRRILYWTADRWDEDRHERERLEIHAARLERDLAHARLVVGSKLCWLIGYLEELQLNVPTLAIALDRLEEARRDLRDGFLPLVEPTTEEVA